MNEVDDIDGCQEDCCPLDTEVEIKHETELVQLRDLGQYRVEEGHLAVLDAALKASEVIKI